MVIHATTDIKKGDELCFTYISPLNEQSERKEKLNGWKFTCECQLCEADAKDTDFSKRRKMMLEFQEYSKIHEKTPQKVIDEGEKLLPKIRETYVERKNFKIDLVLVLNILSSAYEYNGNIEKEIKCLQEIITHAENCPIYALGFDLATKNLAICYSLTGNYVEAKKIFQKASDLSFCTDLEHFKMLYPEVTQYLP
uniref:SET domain-containing protein n=1 Tax=Panagrolaimus davidi TaxID=227884 RepID=A0A914PPY3_9BILA